jgi:hypothetical protein
MTNLNDTELFENIIDYIKNARSNYKSGEMLEVLVCLERAQTRIVMFKERISTTINRLFQLDADQ